LQYKTIFEDSMSIIKSVLRDIYGIKYWLLFSTFKKEILKLYRNLL
jgi:hypothetical protein